MNTIDGYCKKCLGYTAHIEQEGGAFICGICSTKLTHERRYKYFKEDFKDIFPVDRQMITNIKIMSDGKYEITFKRFNIEYIEIWNEN